jgi:hypothetical protein
MDAPWFVTTLDARWEGFRRLQVAYSSSYVTRHTSHVTRHTSHVTHMAGGLTWFPITNRSVLGLVFMTQQPVIITDIAGSGPPTPPPPSPPSRAPNASVSPLHLLRRSIEPQHNVTH